MKTRTNKLSLEKKKSRAAYTFVLHWALGLVLFFIYPLGCSVWYSFNETEIQPGGVVTEFVGFENFRYLLQDDPEYMDTLLSAIGTLFYSLPFIIAVSLIFAVLLNQNFKGRTLFRAIFFFPVILSNSVVMNMLKSDFIAIPLFSTGGEGTGIINYTSIITNLKVPSQISPMLIFLLSNTIDLLWGCGVQIVLFLAGLQNISPSLYPRS